MKSSTKFMVISILLVIVLASSTTWTFAVDKVKSLSDLNCMTDQIARYDGNAWVCADDNDHSHADLEAAIADLQTKVAGLQAALAAEEAARVAAEAALQVNIEAEVTARATADEGLQTQIDANGDKLIHFSRSDNDIFITGANLHVVNGTGTTDGLPNGLGNVIIGYNELREALNNDRSGSHMLVVGSKNNYSSFGGIVAGLANETSGEYASVSGGFLNTASGPQAAVSGGSNNKASGLRSSVSGGGGNEATGIGSSVTGGQSNEANGQASSISGGLDHAVWEPHNWAAGSLFFASN